MLARENTSTDLSSSDEETEKLKAALDTNFLTDNLYKEDASNRTSTEESKPLPSLRNQNREIVTVNPYTIKVTPDFQKHVSKHLSRILDELFDDTESFLTVNKVKKKKKDYGVRLLKNSKNYITAVDSSSAKHLTRKFFCKSDSYATDIENKAKEVAVTPEWVLSQEETKNWAPNTKGEVEVIKLDADNKILGVKKKRRRKKKTDNSSNSISKTN